MLDECHGAIVVAVFNDLIFDIVMLLNIVFLVISHHTNLTCSTCIILLLYKEKNDYDIFNCPSIFKIKSVIKINALHVRMYSTRYS